MPLVNSQCRSRILTWTKMAINGTVLAKSLTLSFNPLKAGFLRQERGSFRTIFCISFETSSMSSGFKPSHMNSAVCALTFTTSLRMLHNFFMSRMVFSIKFKFSSAPSTNPSWSNTSTIRCHPFNALRWAFSSTSPFSNA